MEFYYHQISPPTQAVWMLLNTLGIKYEAKFVDLFAGKHKTPEYLIIAPTGKVPAIKDGGFALAESRAIAIYLCMKYEDAGKEHKLYPTELQVMAKMNMMLGIDEGNYQKIYAYANIGKMLQGLDPVGENLPGVHQALALIENFLAKSKFLAGDYVTIADYFALTPSQMLDLTPFKDYEKYPLFVKWKNMMQKLPHYEESIGKHVRDFAAQLAAKKK